MNIANHTALLSFGIAVMIVVSQMRNVLNTVDVSFVCKYIDIVRSITSLINSQQ